MFYWKHILINKAWPTCKCAQYELWTSLGTCWIYVDFSNGAYVVFPHCHHLEWLYAEVDIAITINKLKWT